MAATLHNEPIAEVVKIRGEITQLAPGARLAAKVVMGDKFTEDTSIVTGPKSFIKIRFIDKSELNVGPESKIIISEMKKDSVGIISLLKGRIRTEVEKDSKTPNTNKFFIKTRTAALGIRGTDFQTIYNPENRLTSLLTFRGEVAMVKVDEKTYQRIENAPERTTQTPNIETDSQVEVVRDSVTKVPTIVPAAKKRPDEIDELNRALNSKATVLVPAGQNSVASDSLVKSSLPVKISPAQLNILFKNQEFQEKSASNLNLQSNVDTINAKTPIIAAKQLAPAEGFFNEKTGDFAPKAGGFIDLNTGLYVAPSAEAKLDTKSGTYATEKIGDIDADTGQYVAPKGLVLDAKRGFIIDGDDKDKTPKAPELLALREDLNKNIAKDVVMGQPAVEAEKLFNINEKFIRDRMIFSLWSMNQDLAVNKNTNSSPYLEVSSKDALRLSFEWQMATNNRFSPLVGIEYSIVNYADRAVKNVSMGSKKLLALSFGTQFALTQTFNLFAKGGIYQDHFLDLTSTNYPNGFNLQKIVLTRLTLGGNAEFWKKNKYSLDASTSVFFTFRKRINNIVVNTGSGFQIEATPKYALSDKKWIGLGLKIEHQNQKVDGTAGVTKGERDTKGLELKYIADF